MKLKEKERAKEEVETKAATKIEVQKVGQPVEAKFASSEMEGTVEEEDSLDSGD